MSSRSESRATTPPFHHAARSAVGAEHDLNEDAVYAGRRLLAVAGGSGGGGRAAQLAIETLRSLDGDEPVDNPLGRLYTAVGEANTAIAAAQPEHDDLSDPGIRTSMTAILLAGNRFGLAHIGNTRGYLLRAGRLARITRDDTVVQELIDFGGLAAEQARRNPYRHLLNRLLSGETGNEPTLTIHYPRSHDRYLLCSRGVWDPLDDETIRSALQLPSVGESADKLVELGLARLGADSLTPSVTALVADVTLAGV